MSGETILVIEDNLLNMQLMGAILRGGGYAVLAAVGSPLHLPPLEGGRWLAEHCG